MCLKTIINLNSHFGSLGSLCWVDTKSRNSPEDREKKSGGIGCTVFHIVQPQGKQRIHFFPFLKRKKTHQYQVGVGLISATIPFSNDCVSVRLRGKWVVAKINHGVYRSRGKDDPCQNRKKDIWKHQNNSIYSGGNSESFISVFYIWLPFIHSATHEFTIVGLQPCTI